VVDGLCEPPSLTIITGATGWLGRALVGTYSHDRSSKLRLLAHGADDVPVAMNDAPHAEVFVGDVADEQAMARLFSNAKDATVIHAAGVIHPRRVSDFQHANVSGTDTVLRAAARAGVRRFVHVSSNSPFGVNPHADDRFRADEPYHPYLGYGHSKMQAELLVRDAHANGMLETVVVRPPWFYGPWQPRRQTTFFRMVRTGRFPLFAGGSNRRSMVYIENLVEGIGLAELHPAAGGRCYWIADARPYPMKEVVETVKAALAAEGYEVSDKQLRLPSIVGDVAEQGDRFLQGRDRYDQQLHVLGEMNKTIACDITKAREELGYEPRVELFEGMRRSIRWCRAEGIDL
jgi:nucleoside-diphosphate-sugar epimerase